jgi:hypothetical protein
MVENQEIRTKDSEVSTYIRNSSLCQAIHSETFILAPHKSHMLILKLREK